MMLITDLDTLYFFYKADICLEAASIFQTWKTTYSCKYSHDYHTSTRNISLGEALNVQEKVKSSVQKVDDQGEDTQANYGQRFL